jgi:hypothetical protein
MIWFERLRRWLRPQSQPRSLLIVMRLADMYRVHPDQIVARCMSCQQDVGVYPSGQRVIAQYPNTVIICQVCAPPQSPPWPLAPGAEHEPSQSIDRKP